MRNKNNAITKSEVVPGSMQDVANKAGKEIATSWLNCKMAVLCDGSGSMAERDSRGKRRRFDVLEEELEKLQGANPGQIAVYSFGDYATFSPEGHPIYQGGGTDMMRGLKEVEAVKGYPITIVIISDGEPTGSSEEEIIRFAKTFPNKINTIYVGPENERGGRNFLRKLATAVGGTHEDDFQVDQLAAQLTLQLPSGR